MATDVGRAPSRKFSNEGPNGIKLQETTGAPLHATKETVVTPDGEVTQRISRAHSSTGIATEVVRSSDGDMVTRVESPSGERQVTTRHADGSEEVMREFAAPDGSSYRQFISSKGTRTVHEVQEPDGTHRTTEKLENGQTNVWTNKSSVLPDGTKVSEAHMPNGDVSTTYERPNGTSEMWFVHPDGTNSVTTVMKDAEGVKITTNRSEDGSVTTTREWTEQDGSANSTVTYPDGHKDEWRAYEHTNEDGSVEHTEESPSGIVITKKWPNGDIEKETQDPEGNIDRYSLKKRDDGSWMERETRADGSTRETHFLDQNDDGSMTVIARGLDGTETMTTMQMDGRSFVRKVYPDGTSSETNREPDGSAHTTLFDANHDPLGETTIEPLPKPGPGDFHPDQFLEDAQRHLPPSVGTTDPDFQTEPESPTLSDAELSDLSARGIAGPDRAALLDEATAHDDSPAPVPAAAGDVEIEWPPGALGADPIVKDFVPPEPEFTRFTDVEIPGYDEPLRIHGIGDDVAVGVEGEDEALTIHGAADEDLISPIETTPDIDEGALGETEDLTPEFDSDGDVPIDTVPPEPTPEDF